MFKAHILPDKSAGAIKVKAGVAKASEPTVILSVVVRRAERVTYKLSNISQGEVASYSILAHNLNVLELIFLN